MFFRSILRRGAPRRPVFVRACAALIWLLLCGVALPAQAAISLSPSSGPLPNTTAGQPYEQTLTASGGTGPYTFSLVSGSLPLGIGFTSGGKLTGTGTSAGTYNFTVTATDANSASVTQSYSLSVLLPVITLTSDASDGVAGTPLSITFTASGGNSPYTYSLQSGGLPPGMGLSSVTGMLTGTPTTAGTYDFVVRATDSTSGTGAPAFSTLPVRVVIAVPTITMAPAKLNPVNVGENFSVALIGHGGQLPYTYSLSSGALPSGVGLQSTGQIVGPATTAGSYTFTVGIHDTNGYSGQQTYTLDVIQPVVSITSDLHDGVASQPYNVSFQASGGNAPYKFSLSTGALPPGIGLSSSGTLSGIPTMAGQFKFTVVATDSSIGVPPFTALLPVVLNITAPTIDITPAGLDPIRKGVAFSQSMSASGGSPGYAFSLVTGSLPVGVGFSSAGVLSGTATNAGTVTFTVRATDSHGFSGDRTFSVYVMDLPPVAQDDNVSVPANSSQPIAVTGNDTGQITSVAITQAPTHGTATVDGLNVVYAPSTNYVGSDAFKYTVSGPDGTSAPATVNLTVTALPAPVAAAQTVAVVAGQSVVIHGAAGATGAPFTTVAITTPPTVGTATVSGTDITYTAPLDAPGTYGLDFTLANAFGTSAPAHVTLTVNPMPQTVPKSASVKAGQSVSVDLTDGARGGPFTAANVVSLTPANAGTASLRSTSSGYALDFTASASFSGAATLTYTLSNAYATSAPGTVSLTVIGRSDPSKDPEVLGILDAQADAARRLAIGQISNFQRRLENLHNGVSSGFSNGITLSSAGSRNNRDPMQGLRQGDDFTRRYLVSDDEPGVSAAKSAGPGLPGDIAVWAGGAVNFGKSQAGASDNGIDFTTSGLSLGVDKQFASNLAIGVGVGYGHDASDIGHHNSRSSVDSYNVAFYGSYRPYDNMYVDSLLGYQWLSFDARRYVTDNGSTERGSRDGKQWFGSLAIGYEHRGMGNLVSPYVRWDMAHAQLDSYTEQGDPDYALNYGRQTVKTSTGTVGVRAEWTAKRDYGVWIPRLRAEFGHDFQGSSAATMRYADLLTGPMYRATLSNQSRNHTLLGAGLELQTTSGFILRAEYQNLLDNSSRDNQSVLLGVEKKLP